VTEAKFARARQRSAIATAALLLAAIVGIQVLRSRLTMIANHAGTARDVYALPSPEQVTALSLGHRAALADLLFANVLVTAGIHMQEKRPFEFVDRYLDTINALDPTFRDPYQYADTLMIVQAVPVGERAYFRARDVLRRGLKTFPFDTELWESAGQFLAYLAPNHLQNPSDQEAFRLEGARDLARSCELISGNANVPYHCIGAARLLNAAGERTAAAQFLRRVLAVNDDPEIRRAAFAYLNNALSASESEAAVKYREAFQRTWRADFPFVTRSAELILAPPNKSAQCAGTAASHDEQCASSWRDFGEHLRTPAAGLE
jgi:hypothetical protein